MPGAEPLLADDEEHARSWFVYPVRLAAEIDREHVIAELERGRHPDEPLPAIDPPPVVHARAVRVPRGDVPGLRGGEPPARLDPVPLGHRSRGAGARDRRARRRRCDRRPLALCHGAVHHEGREPDPRALRHPDRRHREAQRRRGDARARPGDEQPLPPARARRCTSSSRAVDGSSSDGESGEVAAGDAIPIPPGTWHTLTNTGSSPLRLLCTCAPPYRHEDTFFD